MIALSVSATGQGRSWRHNPLSSGAGPLLRAWAMDTVLGSEATSVIRSASCEAASRLPSAWPGTMVWMYGDIPMDHMLLRKSSCTFGARLFNVIRNGTACGLLSLRGLGAGGSVDHMMTTDGALAQH